MKNIYVGNVNYATTDDELATLFGQYGAVRSARVIFDRMTNRSKGFGFVEMEDDDAADRAISALDGNDFQGRALKVSVARGRSDNRGDREDHRDSRRQSDDGYGFGER